MPDRRPQLADAALAVVAQAGLKGLTHRAVDAAAAVAEGTTSNYFRNRAALVDAVVDRLEQLDVELLQSSSPAGPPANVGEVAEQVTGLIFALMEEHATLTRARLAMSLDRPESVTAGHFRLLAGLERTLAGLGIPDAPGRARDVADYCDGLLVHQLTARRAEHPDPASTAGAIRRLLAT
ncbi:TetR family transcriptional regulator [Arthrobacter sp. ISL-48]|uniref:TetR/AcrR family transcriptional regulator n=1 Tax=Arthrobacter sp. ISL-48 TaxID=2819110 RepID=UPI001BE5B76C|nr:TetR family transcriptional regulator [Arthrobacter sp. ISL-48]MBT2533617.1 TetR family transcriptional regulator [Arthrobacter sp. ISL-48]